MYVYKFRYKIWRIKFFQIIIEWTFTLVFQKPTFVHIVEQEVASDTTFAEIYSAILNLTSNVRHIGPSTWPHTTQNTFWIILSANSEW